MTRGRKNSGIDEGRKNSGIDEGRKNSGIDEGRKNSGMTGGGRVNANAVEFSIIKSLSTVS